MIKRRSYDTKGLARTDAGSRYFYKGGVNWAAVIAWLLGILVGLAFTVSPWFSGPFAIGIFASSSLGYLLGFVVSALVYWMLYSLASKETAAEGRDAPIHELQSGGGR